MKKRVTDKQVSRNGRSRKIEEPGYFERKPLREWRDKVNQELQYPTKRRIQMKRILITTVLVVAALAVVASSHVLSQETDKKDMKREQQEITGPNSKAEQEIIKLENELTDLTKRTETAALARILSDDFTFIGGFGRFRDRANYLEMISPIIYEFTSRMKLKYASTETRL